MPEITPRNRMSSKRRHPIISDHCPGPNLAPCFICGAMIHRTNDRWTHAHVRALALLGKDTNTNCSPAHYLCGIAKTASEARTVAKAKRQARTAEIVQRPPGHHAKRGFWKPNGAFFDWKIGRYVR